MVVILESIYAKLFFHAYLSLNIKGIQLTSHIPQIAYGLRRRQGDGGVWEKGISDIKANCKEWCTCINYKFLSNNAPLRKKKPW